ncbi:MAG: sigma-70 family RNA polymerase sigma factor [Verrucomicrobiae bacterium]|nr:sigma-70 family RNA polymerase sigma factor [Verrucomicrobiae bacterium]
MVARCAQFDTFAPMPADPDAILMSRVKRGDTRAFAELVDKYKQPIINFIARMLGDQAEAEDLAQTVFVQVYRASRRYRESAKFSTWIYTIARNFCLNELRRRARHPAEPMEPALQGEEKQHARQYEDTRAYAPSAALLQTELEQKLEQALTELPPNQRMAILLCCDQQLSYEEIAAVLGCSLAATKSLIFRARETLKARLKPYLRTGVWKDHKKPSNFGHAPV